MNTDLCQTTTVQTLVNCLVRHLQKRRATILEQVPSCGGPITEETRPLSDELDQFDDALTALGVFDTRQEG